MKKKVIGVLLATAMAFGLAACGNSAGGEAVKQETEKAEEAKAGTKEEKSGEVTTVTLWSFKAEDNDRDLWQVLAITSSCCSLVRLMNLTA